MNETLGIIEHLRGIYLAKYGDDQRVGGSGRRDTLCYATQVNQDALSRALTEPGSVAMLKFCYVDVRADTDPVTVFTQYRQRIAALRKADPGR